MHGASRLFGRKDAERQLWRAEMNAWIRCREVMLIGADFDESPMAYRRLPNVLPACRCGQDLVYAAAGHRGGGGRWGKRIEMRCGQIDQVTKIGSTPAY